MLELFGPRALEATGIDRSSEMLRLARAKLDSAGIRSSLRQGDMYALPLGDCSADSIIIHQVLHYAHSPAAAIAEAARVLAPGGTLLVVDFAAHEREELRASDAHIRLGFEDEVMAGWFAAAGLAVDQPQHLEGGELTVTLWRGIKAAVPQRRAA
jgi:ArsR family transcriptional regulator